jgi:hypothetical protein
VGLTKTKSGGYKLALLSPVTRRPVSRSGLQHRRWHCPRLHSSVINGQLAIDLGGLHFPETGTIEVDQSATILG